jgi:hypothetical protein
LVSFFLEWVPQMQPQVALIACPATEPHMERWTSLSPRLGNEPSAFRFTVDFFAWWRRQLVVIEDFPYVGVDFRGSADLVLPEGIQWDASGTKDHNLVTIFFLFFICFWLYDEGSKSFCFHHADRGVSRPTEMPTLGCRGDAQAVTEHDVIVGGLREVERNLVV